MLTRGFEKPIGNADDVFHRVDRRVIGDEATPFFERLCPAMTTKKRTDERKRKRNAGRRVFQYLRALSRHGARHAPRCCHRSALWGAPPAGVPHAALTVEAFASQATTPGQASWDVAAALGQRTLAQPGATTSRFFVHDPEKRIPVFR